MKRPPEVSITRLAIYLRFLEECLKDTKAKSTTNSEELARALDINPHQIRKDLSYFGKFGKQGIGYRVKELRDKIKDILGLEKKWNLCLCGMGNLGSALFAYRGFREMSLNIVAIFDNDPKKMGRKIQGTKVYGVKNIRSVVRRLNIDIAILTVPASSAQEITDRLVDAGISAILNFAPIKISVPSQVKLRNADLANELINLTYFLSSVKLPGYEESSEKV